MLERREHGREHREYDHVAARVELDDSANCGARLGPGREVGRDRIGSSVGHNNQMSVRDASIWPYRRKVIPGCQLVRDQQSNRVAPPAIPAVLVIALEAGSSCPIANAIRPKSVASRATGDGGQVETA